MSASAILDFSAQNRCRHNPTPSPSWERREGARRDEGDSNQTSLFPIWAARRVGFQKAETKWDKKPKKTKKKPKKRGKQKESQKLWSAKEHV